MKKLFVIDTMAMIFRSYHAFGQRPLKTSKGLNVSAVYGSLLFLQKLIADENPDYLVFATDTQTKSFRADLYAAYKAHRKEMPEDLVPQLPLIYEMIAATRCPLLVWPGYEADDLIGALAKQFGKDDLKVYIVSGDKDFMQLVDKNIFLYAPKKGATHLLYDEAKVFEKFSCHPNQVIDLLALWGDSSDNIPGVKGIGEKGATKLITEFHSLENLYNNLESIKNKKLRENLHIHKESAFLSQKLVTIKIDIDLDFTLESAVFHRDDFEKNQDLAIFYKKLEFKGQSQRIEAALKNNSAPEEIKAWVPKTLKNYCLVNSRKLVDQFIRRFRDCGKFSFKILSTGTSFLDDKILGVSISFEKNSGYYFPLTDISLEDTSLDEFSQIFKFIFMDDQKLKITHDLKYHMKFLSTLGVVVNGPFEDLFLMGHLLSSAESPSFDDLCDKFLQITKIKESELLQPKNQYLITDIDVELLCFYAAQEADLSMQLFEILDKNILKENLGKCYRETELPLVSILANMELRGIALDKEILAILSTDFQSKLSVLEKEIYNEADEEFNINSVKQLRKIIFEKLKIHETLGLKKIKKKKSGYSTDTSVLEQMSEHPLPHLLLEYRQLSKLLSTYALPLPLLVNEKTGRLHTHFNQAGTTTGRLSSSNPNLQNIPIRTPFGRAIRKAFIAEKNYILVGADYSQIELRILAHLSDDPGLINAFLNHGDIHSATASKVLKKPIEELTSEDRSLAKAINYGLIYGMGPQRLAKTLKIDLKEARGFMDQYFESFPGIKIYIDQVISKMKENGFVTTILGRKRYFYEQSEASAREAAQNQNMAVNTTIQGSAADLMKKAMIDIQGLLSQESNKLIDARLLLQVHDELVYECLEEQKDTFISLIKKAMEDALELKVPLVADVYFGPNWLEVE